MTELPPAQRVEVTFVGAAPAERVARASGVSDVEVDGTILRCVVWGSFQPFLEALRGYEVTGLESTPHRGGHREGGSLLPIRLTRGSRAAGRRRAGHR